MKTLKRVASHMLTVLQRAVGTEGLAAQQAARFLALDDAIASLSTAVAALHLDRTLVRESAVYTQSLDIVRLLAPSDIDGASFTRVGAAHDGGYVMVDDIDSVKTPIAYSIGINRDVSWDTDIANRGIDVFMYDHTIPGLPTAHPRFHFHRLGLTGTSPGNALRTLAQIVSDNHHDRHGQMLLKLDIEGAEWDALAHASSALLARFSQIVIELHGLLPTTHDGHSASIRRVLEKLLETHCPVHVHGNSYGNSLMMPGLVLPACAEVTYVSRAVYGDRLKPCTRLFPTHLDASNHRGRCDMLLGDMGASLCRST